MKSAAYVFLFALTAPLVTPCAAPQAPDTSSAASQASPALPALPKEPDKIIAAAAPLYDFSSPTLKPWHIKVSYQLYDLDSKPTEQGTFEYWWAAPEVYRSTWKRGGMERSDWTVNGEYYHVESGGSLGYFERNLLSDLETPLVAPAKGDPAKVHFESVKENLGSVNLPCVRSSYLSSAKLAGRSEFTPANSNSIYCFDSSHPVLLAYLQPGGPSVAYRSLQQTQGLILPKEFSVTYRKRSGISATVEALELISSDAPEFTPPTPTPAARPDKVEIASGVSAGLLSKFVRPVYPEGDKMLGNQGVVVIAGVVGTDGKVRDLEVLSGLSKSLNKSAIDAVSQWQYKPYLLDGVPVEVETTVDVTFSLNR
jgi:TonB family protein